MVEDGEVHGSPQVVNVGYEDVLLALGQQCVQQARVVEAGVDVPVPRGVPGIGVRPLHAQVAGDRKQGLLVYPWVPGLNTQVE